MFLSKKCKEIMQNEMSEALSVHIDNQRKDRRRRIFEQVALVKIKDAFGYSFADVSKMADWILNDSDKFAEKETKE